MRPNSTIDDIFKNGLSKPVFQHKEEMWSRLEKEMDNKPAFNKQRWGMLLLFLCLLGSGYFFTTIYNDHNKVTVLSKPVNSANGKSSSDVTSENVKGSQQQNDLLVQSTDLSKVASAAVIINADQPGENRNDVVLSYGLQMPQNSISKKINTSANSLCGLASYQVSAIKSEELQVKNSLHLQRNNSPVVKNAVKNAATKISVELEAGTDLFNRKRELGYYAGARIVKGLGNGRNLSVGLNYSVNKLSESYRLLDKPYGQTETDAILTGLTMLRLPIQFQQRIPSTKITCLIGLTPAYILDASIYNVPQNYGADSVVTGDFTINDIHRLNVLFSAGVNFPVLPRLSLELTGNYGLTELVKNSYFNQSTVTANFKNFQAALIYKLR